MVILVTEIPQMNAGMDQSDAQEKMIGECLVVLNINITEKQNFKREELTP